MYASVSYIALLGQTDYAITFDYLARGHLVVTLDGVPTVAYTIINAGATVRLDVAPPVGTEVTIARNTPITVQYVIFDPATTITSANLNNMLRQSLFAVQESRDIHAATAAIVTAYITGTGVIDAHGDEIINVGAPTALTSAATVQYVQNTAITGGIIPVPVLVEDGFLLQANGPAGTWGWFDYTNIVMEPYADGVAAAEAAVAEANAIAHADLLGARPANTRLANVHVYPLAGSPHNWNKPANLDYIVVEAWGGGGSGAAGYGVGGCEGGGGGGGYVWARIDAATLGAVEVATVGAGGAASAGGNGNAGGNTTFGAHLTASGGGLGTRTGTGDGISGLGGAAVGGQLNIAGGVGSRSSGGTGQGTGGSSPRGGAGGSTRTTGNLVGVSGQVPGGGSSSGKGAGFDSGAGADGLIIVYEHITAVVV